LCATLRIEKLGKSDDIFAAGLDSLSVFKILASLRASIASADGGIINGSAGIASTIYTNPTIERLSQALQNILPPNLVCGTLLQRMSH